MQLGKWKVTEYPFNVGASSNKNRAVSRHTADREYCLDSSSTQPFLTLDKSISFFSLLYFKKNDLSVCTYVGKLYAHEYWCLLSPEAMDFPGDRVTSCSGG